MTARLATKAILFSEHPVYFARDDHIKLIKANIKGDGLDQFSSYSKDEIDDLEAPYDTCSVMHYPETAFSKVGVNQGVPFHRLKKKIDRYVYIDID